MTGALALAGFDAEMAVQPPAAINTICALLGWVPAVLSIAMLLVVIFHPIEKEMAEMAEAREAKE